LGNQIMSHAWNAVDKAVGLKVKLTTVDGGEVEGYLFTFDSKLNTLVIQEVVSTDPKKYNIRMLKSSAVTKVSVLPGDSEVRARGKTRSLFRASSEQS